MITIFNIKLKSTLMWRIIISFKNHIKRVFVHTKNKLIYIETD